MPRDSSGTYTRTTGHPVTTGTAISSSEFNALTADMAAEITDSLSRSGKGGMTAPFKHYDGSAAAPGITFDSDPNTGFYRPGDDRMIFVAGGSSVADLGATQALRWIGRMADAATAIGHIFDTGSAWSDAAAKIASFRNNTVEKAAVLFDGTVLSPVFKALGATSVSVKGATADNGTAVGVILDNTVSLSNAAAKLASVRNAGVEKAAVLFDGTVLSDCYKALTATSATVKGAVVDGASAVGVILDNAGALANAAAKAVSVRVNGTERAFFNGLGALAFPATTTDTHGQNPASTVGIANQLRAKNVPKAWGTVLLGTSPSVSDGFNVASVSISLGTLRVTFATAMADANYAVLLTPGGGLASNIFYVLANPAVGYFEVKSVLLTGAASDIGDTFFDGVPLHFVVFGRQDT